MRRRDFIALVSAAAVLPLRGRAEQPTMPRVGYIWVGRRGTDLGQLAGLQQGLADNGRILGRNLLIEERYADGSPDRVPALIAELLALRIDVLVTPGHNADACRTKRDKDPSYRQRHRQSGRHRAGGEPVPSGRQYYRAVPAIGRLQREVVGASKGDSAEAASSGGFVEPG